MTLILLAGLLVAQGVSIWLQWDERSAVVSQARGFHVADHIAAAVRVLEASAPPQRASALAGLQYGDVRVNVIEDDQIFPNTPRGAIQALLNERLGRPMEVRTDGRGRGLGLGLGAGMQRGNLNHSFDVRLMDGQWLRVTINSGADVATPALPNKLLIQLAITFGLVIVAVMIAVRQATRPLQKLAQAADTLGSDLDAPPLSEEGTIETRHAAQSFNRMQAKIRRLVSERARALAAVSHDLRTPLTRLRLRTELIDDESLRGQMTSDLEAMASMIDSTLDYLRGIQASEVLRAIDINALLESMAEDSLVLGRSIHIEGKAHQPLDCRLSALRRALQNLIDNAFKYGHEAAIRVDDNAEALSITVEDEGPGLAESEFAKVTEPYYRLDSARSQDGGGVGLGLSIVKDVALMHGGELTLANRPQGGLAVTLRLPRT